METTNAVWQQFKDWRGGALSQIAGLGALNEHGL
jgi:hypothetical protein